MSVFDLTIPGATLARELLLAPDEAKEALAQVGFQDPERALRNLEALADPHAFGQLQRVSALSEEEADSLKAAYVFYRRLEHRLQMMHNRSDYVLP